MTLTRPNAAVIPTCLLLALTASTAAQGSPSPDSSPPGRVVSEIDPRIWCVHQGRNGDYWFGSNGSGAYRYDGQEVTQYRPEDGLSGLQVRDIEEDAEGNVFISTYGGVSKFDGERFTTLEPVEATPGGAGWDLRAGDVWILDFSEPGPCRYDGEQLYRLELPKSPAEDAFRAKHPGVTFSPSGVYCIYEDRRGHVWFGTSSVGLCRFDGETLSWMYEERLTATPEGGAFGIRSIFEDRAGGFWICNTRQRFEISPEARLENGVSLVQYTKKEGLPDSQSDTAENFTYFPSITEDDAGALWMACADEGVWKYDGKDVTRYSVGDGAYVFTLYRDRAGKLWAGTLERGLHTFEGEGFEPFAPGK